MHKSTFIFIVFSFLLLPFQQLNGHLIQTIEVITCIAAIAIFGISHGAIDNHLYGFKSQKENIKFIGVYVFSALCFGAFWYFSPDIAFASFLIISAYHFGQSQFVEYIKTNRIFDRILFSSWGTWLLAAFIYSNRNELISSLGDSGLSLPVFSLLLTHASVIFIFSTIALIGLLFYFFFSGKIEMQKFFLELYQLFAILFVFSISSPLLGFTLYFVILHSCRVLGHEFSFFKNLRKNFSFKAFVKLLLPFTAISISGLLIFLALLKYFNLSLSIPIVSLIFISCLTFPHSLVMDIFYHKHRIKINS
ncbi:MAG: Brp/Blh family beta-carotene 15,15'-dioxygenase [Flavobacteriales bacterium]|jgi:Brp/Blh family beta-carotene 15,15'-monooxygenase